jgi:methylglutaconyl-CoA hydratase
MEMKYVLYSVLDRIAFITLNRPEKRNAMSNQLVSELKYAFLKAEEDTGVKVVILKANGEAFSAGADLEYLQQLQQFSFEQNFADSNHLKELFLQIYSFKKVVIAQVQGHAIAGGCGLATVCDFTFAAPEAKFGYTEVKIGFIPAIVMVFLIRKIGESRSRQLLLSGSLISADQAKRMGVINEIVSKEDLDEYVIHFAAELIVSNSSNSMSLTKQMMAKVQTLPLEEALDFAAEMNAKARESQDCKRGVSAFVNKEKISW